MPSHGKSSRKKRKPEENKGTREPKRTRLEDYFNDYKSNFLHIQDLINKIKEEEISLAKLKSMVKVIGCLNNNDISKCLVDKNIKVLDKLMNFAKNRFMENFQETSEYTIEHMESVLAACAVCFFLFNNDKSSNSDNIQYINGMIFYLRKILDKVNELYQQDKINEDTWDFSTTNPGYLIQKNLQFLNEIIKTNNLSSTNQEGLIKSLIHTLFYNMHEEILTPALSAILILYEKGLDFQALVINTTFECIGEIPVNHKFKKRYLISKSLKITMFSALLIALIENVPILLNSKREEDDIQSNVKFLNEILMSVMNVIDFIITTFMKNIGMKNDPSKRKVYRKCLQILVNELLEICNEPEWPSARLFLNYLLKPLTQSTLIKNYNRLRFLSVQILISIIKEAIDSKYRFTKMIDSLKCKFNGLKTETDFTEFCQKILVNHLTMVPLKKINKNCILLHVMQWLHNTKGTGNIRNKISNLLKLFTNHDVATVDVEMIDIEMEDEEKCAVTYYLDTVRPNYTNYSTIFKYVLNCCNDYVSYIKGHAIRYVLDVAARDMNLLSQSAVARQMYTNILLYPAMREDIWNLIEKFLTNNPDMTENYSKLLIRSLSASCESIIDRCIKLIRHILQISSSNLQCKMDLCFEVLKLIQSRNLVIKKKAVDFWNDLRLTHLSLMLNILLEIMKLPHHTKYVRCYFEEISRPEAKPSHETIEACKNLVNFIMEKLETTNKFLCLQLISVLVTINPSLYTNHFLLIGKPLTSHTYTNDNAVEILTAEILNCIITKTNLDVLKYKSFRSELLAKLICDEVANYSIGFIVSLLKLLKHLSKFDIEFLFTNILEPSFLILHEYMRTDETSYERINKDFCKAIYLHYLFPNESEKYKFATLMDYFINKPLFVLPIIHCLCYLSIDYKLIMKNATIMKVIEEYFKDKSYPLPLKAVLYLLKCSVQQINKGQLMTNFEGDSIEPVKILINKHIEDILNCAQDCRQPVRKAAYEVIKQMIISGLISELRLIPSVLLMSTDPVDELSAFGIEAMRAIDENNLFQYLKNVKKYILESMTFNERLDYTYDNGIFRGYKIRGGNIEARCNYFYVICQENKIMRRKLIDSILEGMTPDAETSISQKLYLADNLVYFHYIYQEEVSYIILKIDTVLMNTEIPDSFNINDTDCFVNKFYGLALLVRISSSLSNCYDLSNNFKKTGCLDEEKTNLVKTKNTLNYKIPLYLLPGGCTQTQLLHFLIHTIRKKQQQLHARPKIKN